MTERIIISIALCASLFEWLYIFMILLSAKSFTQRIGFEVMWISWVKFVYWHRDVGAIWYTNPRVLMNAELRAIIPDEDMLVNKWTGNVQNDFGVLEPLL